MSAPGQAHVVGRSLSLCHQSTTYDAMSIFPVILVADVNRFLNLVPLHLLPALPTTYNIFVPILLLHSSYTVQTLTPSLKSVELRHRVKSCERARYIFTSHKPTHSLRRKTHSIALVPGSAARHCRSSFLFPRPIPHTIPQSPRPNTLTDLIVSGLIHGLVMP